MSTLEVLGNPRRGKYHCLDSCTLGTCVEHTDAWQRWRTNYRGTCKTIGARYGHAARIALNYDTVFLAELLGALGPRSTAQPCRAYRSFNCMTLPQQEVEVPLILRYSAAATLVLAEFKIVDHIEDTRRRRWRILARLFSRAFRDAQRDLTALEFPIERLRATLSTQSKREREGRTLSEFAAPTVEAMALFFAHGAVVAGMTQTDAATLDQIGRSFGELAYLLDAFEDYEKDGVTGEFNAIRAERGLKASVPLPAEIRGDITAQLQRLVKMIAEQLEHLPLRPETVGAFTSRLKFNLDAKLGLHVLQAPPWRKQASRRERWHSALAFARDLSSNSPSWRASMTVAAVACVAYLAPFHSRAASTPSECLSLGFNVMALGSVFAMAGESDSKNHATDGGGGLCGLMCCSKCVTGRWCCCCDDPDCCCGPPSGDR
jgi:hypothetical protein